MSSAICFKLDQSRILSSGYGLKGFFLRVVISRMVWELSQWCTGLGKQCIGGSIPILASFFLGINDCHLDRIHFFLIADNYFDNDYLVKQPVAL